MTSTAAPAADFSCAICLDTATEPVVTRCGHLFCWECLDHWLHSAAGAPECPVCKGRVDGRIAGDIIPLYGKGKAAAKRPDSAATSAGTTTATTGTTEATEATAVDPGQQAFFSRPSAYSFAPGRDARRGAAAAPQQGTQGQSQSQEEHHPRPSADRAPPRPRPPQQHQNVQMHMHTHGMPLTVGSSVFFFGGGGGMLLSIVLIVAWAIFNYAPWREWRTDLTRWYHRARGDPVPEEHRDGAAPNTNTTANSNAQNANNSPGAATNDTNTETNGLPSQQAVARNLILSLLVVFVLFQVLLFM